MSWRPWLPIPLIALATLVLTWQVHARTGDETIRCVDAPQSECMVGSGWSWILTGIAITAPTLIHLGWRWTARLRRQNKLDPLRRLVIPDYEEIRSASPPVRRSAGSGSVGSVGVTTRTRSNPSSTPPKPRPSPTPERSPGVRPERGQPVNSASAALSVALGRIASEPCARSGL